jgi:hypothetical protein
MALAFGRLDVAISPAQPAKDQGHAAYMAAVLCDIKFNSPFVRYGSFARSRNVIYCATVVTFTLSVLAHDVSGLLNKSRRKRAQLGSALEKVIPSLAAAPYCGDHAVTIIACRILSEQPLRLNASATRVAAGTSGCSCERPMFYDLCFSFCFFCGLMAVDCWAMADIR